jgi:hypothetical protein
MKRAYEVRLERGENWEAYTCIVIATGDMEAVRKAKFSAHVETQATGWRCVDMHERHQAVVP